MSANVWDGQAVVNGLRNAVSVICATT